MRDLYTKKVEVNPGDTIVHANGETWEVPANLPYILVQESTIIEATGPVVARIGTEKLRILAKKARRPKTT